MNFLITRYLVLLADIKNVYDISLANEPKYLLLMIIFWKAHFITYNMVFVRIGLMKQESRASWRLSGRSSRYNKTHRSKLHKNLIFFQVEIIVKGDTGLSLISIPILIIIFLPLIWFYERGKEFTQTTSPSYHYPRQS